MDALKIYDYLILTRERVMNSVRTLTPQQYQHQFAFGLKTLGATLTHIMVSEWYYIERLEGRDVPPYEHWPLKYENPPEFEVVESTWSEQQQRIRNVIRAEKDWSRRITWLGFPDDNRGNKRFQISCTAGDLFTQLALHEAHHRAQIMAMIRLLPGGSSPLLSDLDYNAHMFQRVEAR